MRRSTFSEQSCSVARTLDIIGDRWTPLVLRDIAVGVSRFDAIQRDLGISRKVLAQRLQSLVDHDVLVRVEYQANPPRHDYRLTAKGNDLAMVLLAMQQFGDRWAFGEQGPPITWRHLGCGHVGSPVTCCAGCGEEVGPGDAVPLRGPSFDDAAAPEIARALDAIDAAFGPA
jgi:DNA-binding HxlR family transcriptional regulator